ncbi:uncharacterized protein N7483_008639 [Penicillium malachiteum]|uniref:uncharacterized protein n=1 Tax=Penicillium malachiteum TaxID=1324776 RepID=UPI00254977EE|nr:uncharacterized protein N7483_008639 [Penicillium malachiteum]KAJ5720705.1 hypothetical protein N7483_008639 [Penicillium malachiteum]
MGVVRRVDVLMGRRVGDDLRGRGCDFNKSPTGVQVPVTKGIAQSECSARSVIRLFEPDEREMSTSTQREAKEGGERLHNGNLIADAKPR